MTLSLAVAPAARPLPATFKVDHLSVLWIEYDEALDARRRAWQRCGELGCTPGGGPAMSRAAAVAVVAWQQAELVCRAIARRIRRAEIILAGLTAAHVAVEGRRLATLDRWPNRWRTDVEGLAWSIASVPVREGRYPVEVYVSALDVLEARIEGRPAAVGAA